MNNDIQKDEWKKKDDNFITLAEVVDHYLNGVPATEDADFEVVPPDQLEEKRKAIWDKISATSKK